MLQEAQRLKGCQLRLGYNLHCRCQAWRHNQLLSSRLTCCKLQCPRSKRSLGSLAVPTASAASGTVPTSISSSRQGLKGMGSRGQA